MTNLKRVSLLKMRRILRLESEESSDSEGSCTQPSESSSSGSESNSYQQPRRKKLCHKLKKGNQGGYGYHSGWTGGTDTDEEIEQWKNKR